jgi:hypothetical protein
MDHLSHFARFDPIATETLAQLLEARDPSPGLRAAAASALLDQLEGLAQELGCDVERQENGGVNLVTGNRRVVAEPSGDRIVVSSQKVPEVPVPLQFLRHLGFVGQSKVPLPEGGDAWEPGLRVLVRIVEQVAKKS